MTSDENGKRKSINFFRSYMESLDEIENNKAYREAATAILHYAFDKIEPSATISKVAKMVFILVKPTIDKGFASQVNGGKRSTDTRPTLDRHSTDTRPTLDPQPSDTRPTGDRHSEEKEKEKDKGQKNNTLEHPAESDNPEPDKPPDYESIFETLWKLYPRKKGKGQVKTTQKKRLAQVGVEEMTRAINRYKEYISTHSVKVEHQQYGSTFFNSGYIDYLDKNYQKEESAPQKGTPGTFGSFANQNNYDYKNLEQDALRQQQADKIT